MRIILMLALALTSGLASAAWEYRATVDKMEGTKIQVASVRSLNRLSFESPYSDPDNRGKLLLRDGGPQALAILLSVKKGQFICHVECDIRVKFDDGEVQKWVATAASAGAADTIFVGYETVFLSRLKDAKRVKIEVQFFRRGTEVIEFDVGGLKFR